MCLSRTSQRLIREASVISPASSMSAAAIKQSPSCVVAYWQRRHQDGSIERDDEGHKAETDHGEPLLALWLPCIIELGQRCVRKQEWHGCCLQSAWPCISSSMSTLGFVSSCSSGTIETEDEMELFV